MAPQVAHANIWPHVMSWSQNSGALKLLYESATRHCLWAFYGAQVSPVFSFWSPPWDMFLCIFAYSRIGETSKSWDFWVPGIWTRPAHPVICSHNTLTMPLCTHMSPSVDKEQNDGSILTVGFVCKPSGGLHLQSAQVHLQWRGAGSLAEFTAVWCHPSHAALLLWSLTSKCLCLYASHTLLRGHHHGPCKPRSKSSASRKSLLEVQSMYLRAEISGVFRLHCLQPTTEELKK